MSEWHADVTDEPGRLLLDGPLPDGATWEAFTTEAGLTSWWPPLASIDLEVGGGIHLEWPKQGWHLRGTYLALEPPTKLSFTWSWDHEDLPERVVEIELADGRLRIAHTHGSDEERQGYLDGWRYFVGQLAQGPGEDG